MGWLLDEQEAQRVRALDVDARYAYAINMIREHGELWTLKTEDGWVVRRSQNGSPSIPIWPHERFAELEATGEWVDARPARVSLAEDWFTSARASWFEENEAVVTVFLAGTSSMVTAYSTTVELLQGKRRARYDDRKQGSRVALQPKRATRATSDLVQYVRHREIDIVIQRIPEELRTPIGDILQRRSSDAKWLGSAYRGTGDVVLGTKLPVRVSLGRYLVKGQAPEEFGAPKLGQWPPWAVRRFLLYDVLLHEIGHLQVVDPKASSVRRKFASETRAQEFADELRRTLYSDSFDHPPVSGLLSHGRS